MTESTEKRLRRAATEEVCSDLRAIAQEIDASLQTHRKDFGNFIRSVNGGERSTAIVEHQLDKSDFGAELRVLHEVIALVEQQQAEIASLKATIERVRKWTIGTHLFKEQCDLEVRAACKLDLFAILDALPKPEESP